MLRPYQETIALNLSGSFHAFLDGRGRFARALVAQFLVLEARHFDMHVDAVDQGTGDALLVFGGDNGREGVGFKRFSVKPMGILRRAVQ